MADPEVRSGLPVGRAALSLKTIDFVAAVVAGWLSGVVVLGLELAAPVRGGDVEPIIAIAFGWAVLVLGYAAWVFIRRPRRLLRPDYVGLVSAVCAGFYALSSAHRWATVLSVAMLGVAVLSGGYLRWHRDRWAIRRPERGAS